MLEADYGPIWVRIDPYGSVWTHMVHIWVHMDPYMDHMGPYGPIWVNTDPYGSIIRLQHLLLILLISADKRRRDEFDKIEMSDKKSRENKPVFQKYADRKVNMKEINIQRFLLLLLLFVNIFRMSFFKSANPGISGMANYFVLILLCQQKLTFGAKMSKS